MVGRGRDTDAPDARVHADAASVGRTSDDMGVVRARFNARRLVGSERFDWMDAIFLDFV